MSHLFHFYSLSQHIKFSFSNNIHSTRELEKQHSRLLKTPLQFQVTGAFSRSVPTLYTVINTLVVFGYGGYLVIEGSLTIGSLVAFTIYQGRVFGPLQGLMDGFLTMQKSKVALTRVKEILDVEPAFIENGDVALEEGLLKGDIDFKRIFFAYEKEEPILRDLYFHIPAGKVTAIVGPSGVGKTTICHLVMRLFDPVDGRIMLDGTDLRRFKLQWLRKQIGLVSQEPFLFHSTVLENIRFANPEADDATVIEAAKAACIHDYIRTLPEGYDTVVGDRGVRLSGGQKQRVSIARAMLMSPKILILDEATAFLDETVEAYLKPSPSRLQTAPKTEMKVSFQTYRALFSPEVRRST